MILQQFYFKRSEQDVVSGGVKPAAADVCDSLRAADGGGSFGPNSSSSCVEVWDETSAFTSTEQRNVQVNNITHTPRCIWSLSQAQQWPSQLKVSALILFTSFNLLLPVSWFPDLDVSFLYLMSTLSETLFWFETGQKCPESSCWDLSFSQFL